MRKQKIVGDVPGNVLGMMADLFHKLQHGTISPEELESFLKGKNPFEKLSEQIAEWQEFYRKFFGMELDLSGLIIPVKSKGFDRLIVVAQGTTPQCVYDVCAGRFGCRRDTNKSLDEIIDFSFHARSDEKDPYAIWVRDRVEADEELKDKSADQLAKQRIPGIQLDERLICELKYYDETGKHLDIRKATLCAGSRYHGGLVPYVRWFSGNSELRVYWCNPSYSDDGLRSRRVVS